MAVQVTDVVFTVVDCGIEEFNGDYVLDGVKHGKPCYRIVNGGKQTCNHAGVKWHLAMNYANVCYSAFGDGNLPPGQSWQSVDDARLPAPELYMKAWADDVIAMFANYEQQPEASVYGPFASIRE